MCVCFHSIFSYSKDEQACGRQVVTRLEFSRQKILKTGASPPRTFKTLAKLSFSYTANALAITIEITNKNTHMYAALWHRCFGQADNFCHFISFITKLFVFNLTFLCRFGWSLCFCFPFVFPLCAFYLSLQIYSYVFCLSACASKNKKSNMC